MTSDTTYRFLPLADLDHEDARGWYDSYGWHLTTESAGDVTLQAVEYDWLDETDDHAIDLLVAADGDLTRDEAESIVERARTVRDAAESVESRLKTAVTCYQAGDLAGVIEALKQAASIETDHGDSPATSSLRSALLEEIDEDTQ